MDEVSIRDLRNHGGDVLNRVIAGEHLTVTRDGRRVAELRPLRRPAQPARALLQRWSRLPPVNTEEFRSDLDAVLDTTL